jgi:CDP-diacylglycerol--serine O-phosphatidyltransferase
MASLILVIFVFLFEKLGLTKYLYFVVFPLSVSMAVPKKLFKDPTGLLIGFAEQRESIELANKIESDDLIRQTSKPVMPTSMKEQIPNVITGIVVLCGCSLMVSVSIFGSKPWFGMLVVLVGLIADVMDGFVARKLEVQTKFGSYFDELADLTAFGIGPAVFFMRHCIDNGATFIVTCVVGYVYMGASVYRISREIVVHRGKRPLFFVGVTTNMASMILVVLTFIFDAMGILPWLPYVVSPLGLLMAAPYKFFKDPTGIFIGFDEQRSSIEEAERLEKEQKLK